MLNANYQKYLKEISVAKTENDILLEDAILTCCKESENIAKRETTPVYHLYKKQKEIEFKTRQLKASTEILFTQSNQWIQMIGQLNDACKELGDFENALELIQQDIADIVQPKHNVRDNLI